MKMKFIRIFFAFMPWILSMMLGFLMDALFTVPSILANLFYGLLCFAVSFAQKPSHKLLVDICIIFWVYLMYRTDSGYILGIFQMGFYLLVAGYYLLINHAKRRTARKSLNSL